MNTISNFEHDNKLRALILLQNLDFEKNNRMIKLTVKVERTKTSIFYLKKNGFCETVP